MRYVAKPGNLLETSHPDVEESFRWHNWKLSYAELICDWVSATVKLEDYKAVCCPSRDIRHGLTFLSCRASNPTQNLSSL
jgi:hypothetical protein